MYSISKRYSKSAIFSPSMRKATKPNYYQMKGRVIQQTPLDIRDVPTQMITRPYLDKLYKMLIDYKYPIPSPIIPDPTQIIIILDNYLEGYFPGDPTETHRFGSEQLKSVMELQTKPRLPKGYHYEYCAVMYGFYSQTLGTQSNVQFHIDWFSNLLLTTSRPYQIFMKSVDAAINQTGMRLSSCTPISDQQMYISRYSVSSGGNINVTNNPVGDYDVNPWDQAFYPVIDTRATENDLYYGYFDIVPNTGYILNDGFHMLLTVMCIPTLN